MSNQPIQIRTKFTTTNIKAVLTQGARGYSAYEIWLQQGNTGTIQDFLNATDKHYVHQQTVSSNTWVIQHNLDKYGSVTVLDSAGTIVVGSITYNSKNQITIVFNGEFTGQAFIN